MDKFTKTTEVDISNMGLIEEETPQKSKAGKIIAMIISLLLAVSIWLYVVETDDTLVEKEFNNVEVKIVNLSADQEIVADPVTVILTGTNSKLVDIDEEDIIVEIDADKIEDGDTFVNEEHYRAYINGEEAPSIDVKVKSSKIKIKVTRK